MKLYRLVAVIFGSLVFIPISCTLGAIGGLPIVSWLDSRSVEKGDTVHSPFMAVAELKNDREQTIFFSLSQIAQDEKLQEPVSFLMSKPNGSFVIGQSEYNYQVLEDKGDEQVIEVMSRSLDGDSTIWSRYRATWNKIDPLASRMQHVGYMFPAILVGFGFSIFIYLLGIFLKWHSAKLQEQKNAS